MSWSFITSEDLRRAQAKLRSGRGRSAFRRSHSMRVAAGLRTLLPMPLALANVPTFLFLAQGFDLFGSVHGLGTIHGATRLAAYKTHPSHALARTPATGISSLSPHCRHSTFPLPINHERLRSSWTPDKHVAAKLRLWARKVASESRLEARTKAFTGTSACRTVAH